MLKKTTLLLVCAASVTFVSAQFPWEMEDNTPSPSSFDAPPPSEPPEDSPYFMGPTSDEPEPADEAAPAPRKATRTRESSGSPKFSGSQKTCPVCASNRLKNGLSVAHGGKSVHVCSAACIDRVRRNPAKFIEIMEQRGEQLAGQ